MKRLFLLVLFCISTLGMYAQKFSPGIIHTKDGKQIECLVENSLNINERLISYKFGQKSKTERMASKSIKKITYINAEDNSYGEVVYTKFKGLPLHLGKSPQWCGVVIKGDDSKGEVTLLRNLEHGVLCKRPKEELPTFMGAGKNVPAVANQFYKKAAEYFSDYPELAKRILDKEFKEGEIYDIVREYNVWVSLK